MKLGSKTLAVILFVILFGGIAFTTAMGWWQTESTKEPAKFTSGDAAGQYNPADIRGSYTFGDIEKSFGVSAETLKQAFALPAETDAPSFTVKSLEEMYAPLAEQGFEVGTSSVRLFVALYAGLPYDLSTDIYLPRPAAELLTQHGGLSAEQSAYVEAHIVDLSAPPAETAVETPAAAEPQAESTSAETDRTVKGKTTFQDLLNWGVTQEQIEQIMGKAMPAAAVKVKDFCTEQSLDFETLKTALQAAVDQAKP